jgi:hypothetical protein
MSSWQLLQVLPCQQGNADFALGAYRGCDSGDIDAERENKAREELVAYALIGKQYMALKDEEEKANATQAQHNALSAAEVQRNALLDAGTQAQRNALLAQGRYKPKESTRQTLVGKRPNLRAPRARARSEGAATHAGKPQGREAGSGGRGPAKGSRRPADASSSARSKHAAAKAEGTSFISSKHASAFGGREQGGGGAEKSVGDLGPLQDMADAMPKHLTTPKTDSKTRLADLESAITDTQARLAKEKMRFTEEMLKRQKQLQHEFLESMQQIHAGLSVVDNVGTLGDQTGDANSDKGTLAAEQAAFMQRQRDSVIAAAASATPALTATQATHPTNPVAAEVEREIAASHLFRHPPTPAQATSPGNKDLLEDKEKATINDALEEQFDQVASDGSVAPKVRHDRWTDLMSQMSQALALQKPTAALTADPPALVAPRAQGLGKVTQSETERKTAGGMAVPLSGAETVHAGSQVADSSKAKSRREGLRLLSNLPGFKQHLHTGHVGPASYNALATAAERDMRAAIFKGAPTLAAATTDAMKADEMAHNPQV